MKIYFIYYKLFLLDIQSTVLLEQCSEIMKFWATKERKNLVIVIFWSWGGLLSLARFSSDSVCCESWGRTLCSPAWPADIRSWGAHPGYSLVISTGIELREALLDLKTFHLKLDRSPASQLKVNSDYNPRGRERKFWISSYNSSHLLRSEMFTKFRELLGKSYNWLKLVLYYLLGDGPISILIHVLENFLQWSLLPHELPERKTTIVVTIHAIKELGNFVPNQL